VDGVTERRRKRQRIAPELAQDRRLVHDELFGRREALPGDDDDEGQEYAVDQAVNGVREAKQLVVFLEGGMRPDAAHGPDREPGNERARCEDDGDVHAERPCDDAM
jgi:hypothetical protein